MCPAARPDRRPSSTASPSCSARSRAARTRAGGSATTPPVPRSGPAAVRAANQAPRPRRPTWRRGSRSMPDAPGLELIRGEIEAAHPGAVLDTGFSQDRAVLSIDPAHVLAVLTWLREAPGQEYTFLSSLHAADYLPAAPRFAVHYELLNRDRAERIRVKALLADAAAGPVAVEGGPADDSVPPSSPPPPPRHPKRNGDEGQLLTE